MTDRVARRPHGRRAREIYGSPDVHSFARQPVLEAPALGVDDHLLDVGWGGGVFMRHARETSGCRVTGLDHSREVVRLAGEDAVHRAAESLPFADGTFTAVSSLVAYDGAGGEGHGGRALPAGDARPLPHRRRAPRARRTSGFGSARIAHREPWAQLLAAQP